MNTATYIEIMRGGVDSARKAALAYREAFSGDEEKQRKISAVLTDLAELERETNAAPIELDETDDVGLKLDKRWSNIVQRANNLAVPIRGLKCLVLGLADLLVAVGDEEEARKAVALKEAADALLEVERIIVTHPQRVIEALLTRLADPDMPIDLDDERRAALEQSLVQQSAEQRAERDYLVKMLTTEDLAGAILRGHVFVEQSLQQCLEAYVHSPTFDYLDHNLYFRGKIDLARMLGILTEPEWKLARKLNAMRNTIAHGSPLGRSVTSSDERELWNLVLAAAPSKYWPEYRSDRFPAYILYAMVYLWFLLTGRGDKLSSRRLPCIADSLQNNEIVPDTEVLSALVTFSVKAVRSLP
jgi:hypothetical protein